MDSGQVFEDVGNSIFHLNRIDVFGGERFGDIGGSDTRDRQFVIACHDLQHIGMSGQSFGANTTQAVAGQSFARGRKSFVEPRIDAALMMSMGADGVFIGSGIFKSGNPAQRAAACVKATTFFDDAKVLAQVSRGLGEAMVGINVADLPAPHRLAERGW